MTTTYRVSLALLALAACATPREKVPGNSSTTVSASPVRIDSVRPAAVELLGPGVADLTIYGVGFVADSNQVWFDNSALDYSVSADGRMIRMRMQRTMVAPPNGGMPQQVTPGDHTLFVKNARGTSNTVHLTVQSP
jgi:hypothetical protein